MWQFRSLLPAGQFLFSEMLQTICYPLKVEPKIIDRFTWGKQKKKKNAVLQDLGFVHAPHCLARPVQLLVVLVVFSISQAQPVTFCLVFWCEQMLTSLILWEGGILRSFLYTLFTWLFQLLLLQELLHGLPNLYLRKYILCFFRFSLKISKCPHGPGLLLSYPNIFLLL